MLEAGTSLRSTKRPILSLQSTYPTSCALWCGDRALIFVCDGMGFVLESLALSLSLSLTGVAHSTHALCFRPKSVVNVEINEVTLQINQH